MRTRGEPASARPGPHALRLPTCWPAGLPTRVCAPPAAPTRRADARSRRAAAARAPLPPTWASGPADSRRAGTEREGVQSATTMYVRRAARSERDRACRPDMGAHPSGVGPSPRCPYGGPWALGGERLRLRLRLRLWLRLRLRLRLVPRLVRTLAPGGGLWSRPLVLLLLHRHLRSVEGSARRLPAPRPVKFVRPPGPRILAACAHGLWGWGSCQVHE